MVDRLPIDNYLLIACLSSSFAKISEFVKIQLPAQLISAKIKTCLMQLTQCHLSSTLQRIHIW